MDDYVRFLCPACGKKLKAPRASAGKKAHCSCGRPLRVPGNRVPEASPNQDSGPEPCDQSPFDARWFWWAGGAVLAVSVVLGFWLTRSAYKTGGSGPAVAAREGPETEKQPTKGFPVKGDPPVKKDLPVKKDPPEKVLSLDDIVGKWDGPDFSLIIEADGKGMAGFEVQDGSRVHVLIGHYTVDTTKGTPRIAFTLTAAKNRDEFEFLALSKPTPDSLVVKEVKDQIKPNPITLDRRKDKPTPAKEDPVKLDELVGDWDTPAFSLKIEKGGKGNYEWAFSSGNQIAIVVGDLTVQVKEGKTFISMSPIVFGRRTDYQFLVKLSEDKTKLNIEETNNQVKSKTLKKKTGT